jgi:aspartate/methionine/tyrosine aminotransferase
LNTEGCVFLTNCTAGFEIASKYANLQPGDEVIVPAITFAATMAYPLSIGCKIVFADVDPVTLNIDPKDVAKKITDKTKMIVLLTPNNPIGSILEKDNLEGLAEILKDTDIIVLCDEVYERLTYGEPAVSFGSLPGMKERTITMNGFSKAFSMTGWRLGYFAAPKEMVDVMNVLSFYMTACGVTFTQDAAVVALEEEDGSLEKMRSEFEKRRNYIVAEINKTKHFSALMPKGAFYVFMNIKKTGMTSGEFTDYMLDNYRCSFIPGDVFGSAGEGFVRLSYASSMENLERLVVALNDLDAKLG